MSLLADAAFWVSIATLVVAAYRFSINQAYKSKCSQFNLCWGFLNIKREVEIEARIDEHALDVENNNEPDQRDSIV